MMLSLTSIKISIAGARLSHLVRKDPVWDHGSMVEQVKATFVQVQKAHRCGTAERARKYLTTTGYKNLVREIGAPGYEQPGQKTDLLEVDIIGVYPGKHGKPDGFRALLKERTRDSGAIEGNHHKRKAHSARYDMKEQWLFVRQGDWWVLEEWKS
jgi:predicted lipid-binding transport protein (Tim44 family)